MSLEKLVDNQEERIVVPKPAFKCRSTHNFSSSEIESFLSDFPSDYFEFDGFKTHYIDTGENRNHRTMICLHSRYGWAYSFRKFLPTLIESGYRVIAIDLLGFGLSDKPGRTSALSIYAQCCRIKALIQHLGIQDLTIIAHEMSCRVATQLPYMLSDTIEGLVLVNPGNPVNDESWSGLHMWRTLQNIKIEREIEAKIRTEFSGLCDFEVEAFCEPLRARNGLDGLMHLHDNIVLDSHEPDYIFSQHGYLWLRENWKGKISILSGTNDPLFDLNTAKKLGKQIGYKKAIYQIHNAQDLPFEEQVEFMKQTMEAFYTVC